MILALILACSPSGADIAKAVGSDNPVMREDGAKIAQGYEDPLVWDALIKVLADPSQKTKLNAIESLAATGATMAGPALINVLQTDPDPKVRRAAADALGRLVVMDAAPALTVYVNEFGPDDLEQLAGIWALGNIGAQGLPADEKAVVMAALVAKREQTTSRYVLYNANAALRTLR